jgi:hypothetical protein
MPRLLFLFACVLEAALIVGSGPARAGSQYTVVAAPLRSGEAPADEYFGPYRLSSLSIRNAISDMTIEGNSPLALPLQIDRIEAVRAALPVWAQAYPHDPWVPSAIFKFAQFLIGKRVATFDPAALAFLSYLVLAYPHTGYATQAQAAIDSFEMLPAFDQLSGPRVNQLANVHEAALGFLSVRHKH